MVKRKKEKRIIAYIDGSGKGMYGYSIPKRDIKVITKDFPMTNNKAEYLALYRLLIDVDYDAKLDVKSDSQLVVNQFREKWKTRNTELRRIGNLCKKLVKLKRLDIEISWVPRERNHFGKFLDKEKERMNKKQKRITIKYQRGYI